MRKIRNLGLFVSIIAMCILCNIRYAYADNCTCVLNVVDKSVYISDYSEATKEFSIDGLNNDLFNISYNSDLCLTHLNSSEDFVSVTYKVKTLPNDTSGNYIGSGKITFSDDKKSLLISEMKGTFMAIITADVLFNSKHVIKENTIIIDTTIPLEHEECSCDIAIFVKVDSHELVKSVASSTETVTFKLSDIYGVEYHLDDCSVHTVSTGTASYKLVSYGCTLNLSGDNVTVRNVQDLAVIEIIVTAEFNGKVKVDTVYMTITNTSNMVNADCHCRLNMMVGSSEKRVVNDSLAMDISDLYSVTVNTSSCPIHSSGTATTSLSLKSYDEGLYVNLVGDRLEVDNITKESYEIEIQVTGTYNNLVESDDIVIHIQREVLAPLITSSLYSPSTGALNLKVDPRGHRKVYFYVNGERTEVTTTRKGTGNTIGNDYNEIEKTFTIGNGAGLSAVENIEAERKPSNPNKVILRWNESASTARDLHIYVAALNPITNNEVNSEAVDIVTDKEETKKIVTLHYTENGENKTAQIYVGIESHAEVNLSSLVWGSYVDIVVSKADGSNQSAAKTFYIPCNVIYNVYKRQWDSGTSSYRDIIDESKIKPDYFQCRAGDSVTLDVFGNDIHDEAYEIPYLDVSRLEKLSGPGEVSISAEGANDLGVRYITYTSLSTDSTDDEPVVICYRYNKVRSDIDPAFGYAYIELYNEPIPPRPYDDSTNVTDSLHARAGTRIDIPFSLILANDNDPLDLNSAEGLTVSSVELKSTGTYSIDTDNRIIYLTTDADFVGIFTFEYKIANAELESTEVGTVKIAIGEGIRPPTANAIDIVAELASSYKAIALQYDVVGDTHVLMVEPNEGNLNARLNNKAVSLSEYGITISKGEIEQEGGFTVPYIKLNYTPDKLSDGDILTFNYTIKPTEDPESIGTTAKVTVTFSNGDDPNDLEGYLYVHRKPIASFNAFIGMDENKSYVESFEVGSDNETSYDLDHSVSHDGSLPTSGSGVIRPVYSYQGIRAWEWGYRFFDAPTDDPHYNWTVAVFDAEGKSGDLGEGGSNPRYNGTYDYKSADAARKAGYEWITQEVQAVLDANNADEKHYSGVVSLRVRDIDNADKVGVWSEPKTITLTYIDLPPVSIFNLDKSSYLVPKVGPFKVEVTDLSYDPNGDIINVWEWNLDLPDGTTRSWTLGTDDMVDSSRITSVVSTEIATLVRSEGYDPETPDCKLTLKVSNELESDPFSVTFQVYKENDPPTILDEEPGMTLETSTVYIVDDMEDGIKGDDWGELENEDYPGVPRFKDMFKIEDDQDVNTLTLNWLFEGNAVEKRALWSEDRLISVQRAYQNKKYIKVKIGEVIGQTEASETDPTLIDVIAEDDYDGPENPFPIDHTVTDERFAPGAYRITLTAKDNPVGAAYLPDSSKTSFWMTYGDKVPYHMFVIPKLDIIPHAEYNGWIIRADYLDNTGSWTVEGIREAARRISDNATLDEAGLRFEDVFPGAGGTFDIVVKTNKYVSKLQVYRDVNGNKERDAEIGKEGFTDIAYVSTNDDGTLNWKGSFTIPDDENYALESGWDLSRLDIYLIGSTIWGSETGRVTRTKQVPVPMMTMNLKLYDFRVTDITDPNVSDTFTSYITRLRILGDTLDNGNETDGALVGRLAVDTNSYKLVGVDSGHARKGYSFYFKLNSKGLNGNDDYIKIRPKLYKVTYVTNGEIKQPVIGRELVGCLPDNTGRYVVYTTEDTSDYIKEHYELYYTGNRDRYMGYHYEFDLKSYLREISEDGSEQVWYGRYGIPADARFFDADTFQSLGTNAQEWKGDILVTFEIIAVKSGALRFNYVGDSQWKFERDKIVDSSKTGYAEKEDYWKMAGVYIGSTVIFDASKSIKDDYTANPVWHG